IPSGSLIYLGSVGDRFFSNSEFHFVEHLHFVAYLSGLDIFLLSFFFLKKIHSNDSILTWVLLCYIFCYIQSINYIFIYIYVFISWLKFYNLIQFIYRRELLHDFSINCDSSFNIESKLKEMFFSFIFYVKENTLLYHCNWISIWFYNCSSLLNFNAVLKFVHIFQKTDQLLPEHFPSSSSHTYRLDTTIIQYTYDLTYGNCNGTCHANWSNYFVGFLSSVLLTCDLGHNKIELKPNVNLISFSFLFLQLSTLQVCLSLDSSSLFFKTKLGLFHQNELYQGTQSEQLIPQCFNCWKIGHTESDDKFSLPPPWCDSCPLLKQEIQNQKRWCHQNTAHFVDTDKILMVILCPFFVPTAQCTLVRHVLPTFLFRHATVDYNLCMKGARECGQGVDSPADVITWVVDVEPDG
ncbi:hypothetical protein VP01_2452g1, partial [Puccinia sorghi]